MQSYDMKQSSVRELYVEIVNILTGKPPSDDYQDNSIESISSDDETFTFKHCRDEHTKHSCREA